MPTPFTTTPDVSIDGFGNTWVYIGSGKYYSDADKTDTSPQILMGLKDTGVTVAKSAMDDRTSHATTGTVIDTTTACLYDESQGTFAKQKLVTAIKLGGTSALPAPSAKGWYIPLSGGERVISRPLAVGGLVDFLSYKPYGDACSSGGGDQSLCPGLFEGNRSSNRRSAHAGGHLGGDQRHGYGEKEHTPWPRCAPFGRGHRHLASQRRQG